MGISTEDDGSVVLHIPLNENFNDKNTMFAGSIYSAMVLCGMTCAYRILNGDSETYDIVIKHADVNYRIPVKTDARAFADQDGEAAIKANGNASVFISVQLKDSEDKICAVFKGEYIGIPK